MVARVESVSVVGMEARPVEVEVALSGGLPEFHIVGLPSVAVKEARQRVKAAVTSSEQEWPQRRITANLAPGDLRKEGSLLDLPLAVGVLAASGKVPRTNLSGLVIVGELALDGRVRPIRGALAAAVGAKQRGAWGIVVPKQNQDEACLVPGIKVMGAAHLVEALAYVSGELAPERNRIDVQALLAQAVDDGLDLSDVNGQALPKRALEIAAAGGHNLLMVGPPGCGKTMLARRLPGILPPMTAEEALEVTHVWSVAGLLQEGQNLVSTRPFRSVHHHASAAAVVGGGSPWPRPGEISMAHNGVLFMDELPLFSRSVLEGLRQPVEDGVVTIARMGAVVRFPSKVSLIAAANPCLCGSFGEAGSSCSCPPARLEAYRSKLSGPFLDRMDLFVEVAKLSESELMGIKTGSSSGEVRARVTKARQMRRKRNESCAPSLIEMLEPEAEVFVRSAIAKGRFSARGLSRHLNVARTIADLAGQVTIGVDAIAEAMQYGRPVWE